VLPLRERPGQRRLVEFVLGLEAAVAVGRGLLLGVDVLGGHS
jgi:hypothetical protein